LKEELNKANFGILGVCFIETTVAGSSGFLEYLIIDKAYKVLEQPMMNNFTNSLKLDSQASKFETVK
jgi:hypothetical protein